MSELKYYLEILQTYCNLLRAKKKTKQEIHVKMQDVSDFFLYLEQNGISLADVSKKEVKKYLSENKLIKKQ